MLGEAFTRRACADAFTGLVGAPKCMQLRQASFCGGAVLALLKHVPPRKSSCEVCISRACGGFPRFLRLHSRGLCVLHHGLSPISRSLSATRAMSVAHVFQNIAKNNRPTGLI